MTLATLILEALRDRPARTASELVALVGKQTGFEQLGVGDVNSVLYSELAERVALDRNHRWSVVPVKSHATEQTVRPDRASLLRAIHRMRSGLPPFERLEDLTVGANKLIHAATKLLNHGQGNARWMLVRGDYGEGKSHALALFRELAHREGYATCQLSCDGSSSALNHPQRFVSRMLATLEVPGRSIRGYDDLLEDVLRDRALSRILQDVVIAHLTGERVVEVQTRYHLEKITTLLAAPQGPDPQELGQHIRAAASHLSGETIRHRSASPDVRELSYVLLRIAGEFLQKTGTRGICLLLDEVESVYTKLFNARSRRGAYRVLAALCESNELRGWSVSIATTPDAHRLFLADVQLVGPEWGDLKCEPIRGWAARLLDDSLVTVRCRPFSQHEREFLISRVHDLYRQTYGATDQGPSKSEWDRFVAETMRVQLPVRLLVRQAIDYLDARRYAEH